ncbi:MAG: DEAD/DEAH box helicase family protein, partial [Dehalococcoidia bacterium]|nr:DEAD/DEAH box helicase family protein [Dehalococcoidia bacterium]
MAKLRDSDVATVLAGVQDKVVENPETGFLETMDEYLSGNVKRKLKIAKEMAASNPEYGRNVDLLEAALPPDVPSHRITARIGASWIKPEHLSAFVREKMQLGRRLETVFNFNPMSNEWTMTYRGQGGYRGVSNAQLQRDIRAAKNSVEATRVWGTERRNFYDLIGDALSGKRPVVSVYDPVTRKTFMDVVATKAAEDKLQDIQMEFGRWLFSDPTIGDEAVQWFNDIINTSIPMKADGSHLTFPGKSMWMLTAKEAAELGLESGSVVFYPHQANAVWKYLKNGNIYLAHEVGAGKTVTMALIAMEAKRLRGKRKVLYVTLNDSTYDQAVAEIKALYPLANILPVRVSTNEQRKQRALQKLALNDFDIAIMRQQDLDRIALSPESERVFIEEELAEYREILEEAKKNGARIQEQEIQAAIQQLEEKLKAPGVHDEAKRKNLYFDDLGIDLMIVDEAHQYKNVPYATRLTRITGLNPPGSPTAKAFFRKTQYLNAIFPKQDALVLASGTALSNSIAEMYNLQRMLQPQEVKRQGVWSFDRWIANFGDMGSQMEWDGARGAYKSITTNRKIVNAGRMLATAYQNVDSVRAKDTPIKRPETRGGEPQRVVINPNQYVNDYKQIILERCTALDMDPKNAEYEGVPDNMLRIISNMSKVAIDQRLDHHYANTEMQQDSKIAVASKKIFQRWQEEKKHKGVQLVFADLGTPKRFDKFKYKTDEQVEKLNDDELIAYNEEKLEHENSTEGFNVYDGLKQELIKMGIPRGQIAFIHDADHSNKDKKAANLRQLFKKVNNGEIRVLIGSTSKAGTGVNVQQRVSDIHHLDVWWNYSAWEQRNGRGIRAGNIYANEGMPGTYIWNYVTETTVDATRWDKIFAKGKVLNAVLGGDINIDVIEDISEDTMSAKMMAAEASGDPLMSQQATLLNEVQTIRFAQAAYLDNIRSSKMELASIPGRIETLEKNIKDYRKSHDLMEQVTAVRFMGDDRTYVFEKHGKEIIAALEKAIAADVTSWKPEKKAPLLVFGSHTEKEVTETVEGKEKKVKKYTLVPLPVKASITGQAADPFGRRLLLSGDILSSDRQLAALAIDKKGKATIDLKANVSRTVTEYVTMMAKSEADAKETIAELKGKEPKLQKIIEQPWAKAKELEEKSIQLAEIERQMSARGQNAGNPELGLPIDKYQGMVPVIDDIEEPDNWYRTQGVTFAGSSSYPEFGISKDVDLNNFLKNRRKSFKPGNLYRRPQGVDVLVGEQPPGEPTSPRAYTTIDNETLFWVQIGGGDFVTVKPAQWQLMERIIGKDNNWYHTTYDGEHYLVHVNNDVRDAFLKAEIAGTPPSGVQDLNREARPEEEVAAGEVAPGSEEMYALAEEDRPEGWGEIGTETSRPGTLGEVDLVEMARELARTVSGIKIIERNGEVLIRNLRGQECKIVGVKRIAPDKVILEVSYFGTEKAGAVIAGGFRAAKEGRTAEIALVANHAGQWTLNHEFYHWLEDIGAISNGDKTILNRKIKVLIKTHPKTYGALSGRSPAEQRADWVGRSLAGQYDATTPTGKILTKVRGIIDRVVNALGIRTAGGVMRDIRA